MSRKWRRRHFNSLSIHRSAQWNRLTSFLCSAREPSGQDNERKDKGLVYYCMSAASCGWVGWEPGRRGRTRDWNFIGEKIAVIVDDEACDSYSATSVNDLSRKRSSDQWQHSKLVSDSQATYMHIYTHIHTLCDIDWPGSSGSRCKWLRIHMVK